MIDFFWELLLEFLIPLVLEILAEVGLNSARKKGWESLIDAFSEIPGPWLSAISYTLFGVCAGGLSLKVIPAPLLRQPAEQILNLIVTPFAAGLAMRTLGQWRAKWGESVLHVDRFWYGYLFTVALAVTRFWFAQ